MNSQLGRLRKWERREERSRQLIRRARRTEVLVIRVLNALAQRGRSRHADLDAGRVLSELLDVEGVRVAEILRRCGGELDRVEIARLKGLVVPKRGSGRSSDESNWTDEHDGEPR